MDIIEYTKEFGIKYTWSEGRKKRRLNRIKDQEKYIAQLELESKKSNSSFRKSSAMEALYGGAVAGSYLDVATGGATMGLGTLGGATIGAIGGATLGHLDKKYLIKYGLPKEKKKLEKLRKGYEKHKND